MLILLFALPALADEDLSMWQKRMPITFSGYPEDGETLMNFPALVILKATAAGAGFDYSDFMSPPNGDLRFAASDKITPLDFEIDTWDSAGESLIWVRVPELKNNAVIYAVWGQEGQSLPACTTNGAVWADGVGAEWHLGDDPSGAAPQMLDSTANRNHGTVRGIMTLANRVPGMVGDCLSFNGSTHYLEVPDHDTVDPVHAWTLMAWIRRDAVNAQHGICEKYDWAAGMGTFGVRVTSGNLLVGFTEKGFGGDSATGKTTLNAGTWYHVAASFDTDVNQMKVYVNGVCEQTNSSALYDIPPSLTTLKIGGRGDDGTMKFSGLMDEVRLCLVAHPDAWIRASFLNTASNSVFNTYGDPEYQGGPRVTNVNAVSETNYLTLNGFLVSTGMDANISAAVYWGGVDAGRKAEGWDYTNRLPGIVSEGPISINVSPDRVGVPYYFRFFVSNSFGVGWASPAEIGIWWADIHSGTVFATW